MGTQADITINDGAASPASHTFSARGATMDLARYLDITSGIDIGLPEITQSSRKTGKGSTAVNRTEVRIKLPVLEVISGSDGGFTPSPTPAYFLLAKLEFLAPVRSTQAQRKDIVAYAKNLLGLADGSNPVRKAVVDFDIPT